MRHLLLACIVLALAACGTTSSVKLAINAPAKTSFEFKDERLPEMKLSRVKRGPSGAVRLFGDDVMSPPLPDILRATLQERLGAVLKGKVITLREFDLSVTEPNIVVNQGALNASSGGVVSSATAAPLGAGLIFGIESAKSLKTVTIEIRGTLDNVEFYSLVLDEYRGRVGEDDIQASMARLLDKVTKKLQQITSEGG